jgi:hypothetical protein
MGTAARQRDLQRSPLREVYVARTVQEPQPKFESFLNRFGRRLGVMATINTIASTHLTFLESSGIAGHFKTRGYSPSDIRQFRGDLEQHLKETLPDDHTTVTVDESKPLRWVGKAGTLALNIAEDEVLARERNEIELFLQDHFDDLPNLRPFEPHITLGRIHRQIGYREYADPMRAAPKGIALPEEVVLNGLEAYLGRFQPRTQVC